MLSEGDIKKFYKDVERLGLKFPVAAIAGETGYTKGNVSQYLSKKLSPSEPFIKKFYLAFKESLNNVSYETQGASNLTLNDSGDHKGYQKRRLQIKNQDKPPVPVFGGFTTLGNIQVYDDGGLKNKIVAQLPADVFPNCDYAERAKGDSMYPLIINQALLIGKVCPVAGITWGEKYIIKTKEGMDTTKFVHPGGDPGKIKLKAYNKNIPDQEIPIEEIVFVCRVHWIVNPT